MSKIITLDQFKTLATKVKSEDAALGTKITSLSEQVETLVETGGEKNLLEGVKVNGTALAITDKMVDLLIASGDENGTLSVNGVAVAVKGLQDLAYKSEISEDDLDAALKASIAAKATNADLQALTVRVGNIENAGYQTAAQVQAAIAASGHAHFKVAETDPTGEGFEAEENVMYLYMNSTTQHYDIYAKVGESVVLLDDTTVDLSEYAKTADVTSAISAAIAALNIEQYATDTELAAAVSRISVLETAIADVYTKQQVDDKLAEKMNVADMDAYATDEEAAAAGTKAVTDAQATDAEVEAAMNEVWTPTTTE